MTVVIVVMTIITKIELVVFIMFMIIMLVVMMIRLITTTENLNISTTKSTINTATVDIAIIGKNDRK